MDPTIVGHVVIAALNLVTAVISWRAGRRRGRTENGEPPERETR